MKKLVKRLAKVDQSVNAFDFCQSLCNTKACTSESYTYTKQIAAIVYRANIK